MCNRVCHTVTENMLMVNFSLIFKPKRQCSVHLFFNWSLRIKDKTTISLTFKMLHLREGSSTRQVRTMFAFNIIVSIFVKLFMVLILHLRQLFIVNIYVIRSCSNLPFWYCWSRCWRQPIPRSLNHPPYLSIFHQ